MHASHPADREEETYEPAPAPAVRMQVTQAEWVALDLGAKPSVRKSTSKSRVFRERISARLFERASDLDYLLGEEWYLSHSGRVCVAICAPITVALERTFIFSRTQKFDVETGCCSPMVELERRSYIEMVLRFHSVQLFSDIEGFEASILRCANEIHLIDEVARNRKANAAADACKAKKRAESERGVDN